jgi:hypothetical protein
MTMQEIIDRANLKFLSPNVEACYIEDGAMRYRVTRSAYVSDGKTTTYRPLTIEVVRDQWSWMDKAS